MKSKDVMDKPEALERYQMSKSLGVPYVAGGLLDQPWIWVQEHGVIETFLQEWDAVEKSQVQAIKQQPG